MPVSHVLAEVSSLLEMLAGVIDPGDRRGTQYPLLAVLSCGSGDWGGQMPTNAAASSNSRSTRLSP
ncbi:MAG: hypothetical protein J2P17_25365 [Mycobacterium sp.]|nr:hypothetical protein [Mycobacterium sp.]